MISSSVVVAYLERVGLITAAAFQYTARACGDRGRGWGGRNPVCEVTEACLVAALHQSADLMTLQLELYPKYNMGDCLDIGQMPTQVAAPMRRTLLCSKLEMHYVLMHYVCSDTARNRLAEVE